MGQPSTGALSAKDFVRFLRCLVLLIALAVVGIVLLFWFSGGIEREWREARPRGLADEAWRVQRTKCEYINVDAADCAATPLGKIEVAVSKQREKERLELCREAASYDAIENAKKAVSGHLRSPSTAKWSEVRATQKDCDWRVTGTVDAKNAFGGIMRSNFDVRLNRVSDDTWIPTAVRIDD